MELESVFCKFAIQSCDAHQIFIFISADENFFNGSKLVWAVSKPGISRGGSAGAH